MCLYKHLKFSGENVELVPRDVDASNNDVIVHGFHVNMNHTQILWNRSWLDDVDDVVQFGVFVGDNLTVEAGVFGLVLVVNWYKN